MDPGGIQAGVPGGITGLVIPNLTNGTAYSFTVRAVNAVGPGPDSASSVAVSPFGPPGAPTGVTAQRGPGSALVSWQAPLDDNGSPITGYTITTSPPTTTTHATAAPTSATVSGLTNGVSYTFTVFAENAAGAGAGSQPSNAVTPAGVPGAPSVVHASLHQGVVTVSWNTASANGAAISGSTVRVAPGGRVVHVSGSQAHAGVSGLGSGAYTFTVRATNSVGDGAWSSASNAITISTVRPQSHPRSGYWMLGADGKVYAFGNASDAGGAHAPAVAIAARIDGAGYWTVDAAGNVNHFGKAAIHGGRPALQAREKVSTMSATPSGAGYWLFTNRGRVFSYGDARSYGDMSGTALNGPIVASVATPTGHGYFMVGSDGGVFTFGDAHFHGSTGHMHLNRAIVGIAPTADNRGYWLVASDGGVFAFDAPFRGSMGGSHLNKSVNGLVGYGNGYLMVASDGGIFDFSDKAFSGSLASSPPTAPIVGIAAFSTH